uniref:Reverse transcriptase zinc-binding domain-containing protein n=1 Tax=Rhodnius prolixus TaxID=13249 RepID=T1I9H3_RHOPR
MDLRIFCVAFRMLTVTYGEAYKAIRNEKNSQAAVGKRWEGLLNHNIPPDLWRDVAVACFRLATGHDYLPKHLHRIGVFDTPICPLCRQDEMDAEHLEECSALADARESAKDLNQYSRAAMLYWVARGLVAAKLETGVG